MLPTPQTTPALDAILNAIARADRLLVTAHARPDGDAVGSLIACWMMLQRMGKSADMALHDRVPRIYRSLPCAALVRHWSRVEGDYDAVILLEALLEALEQGRGANIAQRHFERGRRHFRMGRAAGAAAGPVLCRR